MSAVEPLPLSSRLRTRYDELVADATLPGRRLGRALSAELDRALAELVASAEAPGPLAVVALGSYGRQELCPASDVDVLLVHSVGRRKASAIKEFAEHLWYPLWDASLVTGHGARTIKESVALADEEPDALTAMLQARHVAGDEAVTEKLIAEIRKLAQRRRDRLIAYLRDACEARRQRPGPVAEMLAPDLKDGAGGLRDVQSLAWAGWTLGEPGGLDVLGERGYLDPDDRARLDVAESLLLDLRVSLHRVNGTKSDRLLLQDQDAVAERQAVADADDLVRSLSAASREVAWIAREVFDRLSSLARSPRRHALGSERVVAEHVVVRDGRVAVTAETPLTPLIVLEAAAAAAEDDLAFERSTLGRIATMLEPEWDVWERAGFLRLLRAGEGAVPVFEALDHAGVLVRLLPEWAHVRSRPQRNAYHRFTVDRHSLEAVAECARLLDAGDAVDDPRNADIDAVVARACRRPELLLLAALLHDVGKGQAGDHSDVGAQMAVTVARRMDLDAEGREIIEWLVHDHLVMADTATRRDLADEEVVERFARRCAGDPERLRLLYLLTIGDSIATGPAAWSRTKAALLRDLFVKTAASVEHESVQELGSQRRDELIERIGAEAAEAHLSALPLSYLLTFDAEEALAHRDLLARGERVIECSMGADARPVVTVVTEDHPGVLAALAGALNVAGLSVEEAFLFSTSDGWALDVFRGVDPFGRYADGGEDRVQSVLTQALDGEIDVGAALRERAAAYRSGTGGAVEVRFDLEGSSTATIVEVEADDEVGLLYRLAAALHGEGLDVSIAKVQTLGDRVIDIFYVRDAEGAKVEDPVALERLGVALTDACRDGAARDD